MAKYLVETYYNCSFKVSHYLDSIDENELSNFARNKRKKLQKKKGMLKKIQTENLLTRKNRKK